MDPGLKKILKSVTLELRHLLEGHYDAAGAWHPGDLEQRLAAIGVRRDRASLPIDELSHLSAEDKHARKVVDAYLKLREDAGVKRTDAIADFVRETAYTWANRLLALRCMEARELIDEVITQKEAYGGRSLEHHRLAQRQPDLCAGEDDGLFAVLDKVFRVQATRLPMLFDPHAPGVALRPSPAAIKDCFALLSLAPETLRKYRIRIKEDENAGADAEPANPFVAPDALGWAYQYWNTEEKDRVFERVRTVKGAKIAGADIVPATQLYTEDYMVKFLVQNSLGATWMGMHPESKLSEGWEYYVKDADRAPVERKPVAEITFLDPACGSGHFLLDAFDLFYAMYQEEGELTEPETICDSILTKNLFGIDIDPRAVQIAEAALWMNAAERSFDYAGAATNLVAATASHLKGPAWKEFLAGFEREPSVARVLQKFAQTMEYIDEIGSLARPDEDLREIIRQEHVTWERQVRERKETNFLFPEMNEAALQGQLPFNEISDEDFGDRLFYRARAAIDAFSERARAAGDFEDQLLGSETRAGFRLVDLLSHRYDVVAANPPYMGSKNMGPSVKPYIDRAFKAGKRDLYTAFILRNRSLASLHGRVAMVTQDGWLTQKHYGALRKELAERRAYELVANLGPGAFEEISGENVTVALHVLRNSTARDLFTIDAEFAANPDLKAQAIRQAKNAQRMPFELLSRLDTCQILIGVPIRLIELLAQESRVRGQAEAAAGLWTGDDARFTRWIWEAPSREYWIPLGKGGAYRRWWGLLRHAVRWQEKGAVIKDLVCRKFPYLKGKYEWVVKNEEFYFLPGATYSFSASASLGVRLWPRGAIFSELAPYIHATNQIAPALAGVLSTRPYTLMLRALADKMRLRADYVNELPEVSNELLASAPLNSAADFCINCAKRRTARDLLECDFHPSKLVSGDQDLAEMAADAIRLTCEALFEKAVDENAGIDAESRKRIQLAVGPYAAQHPLVHEYDAPPTQFEDSSQALLTVRELLRSHPKKETSTQELNELRIRVRREYESESVADVQDADELAGSAGITEEDDDDNGSVLPRVPVPAETVLEMIAQKVEIHPVSVYWILRGGIESEQWRDEQSRVRLCGDRITVTVLRLLGHRWPRQIEAGEPVPAWADSDGIIPLTPIAHESTLIERVQARLQADEIDASDFAEVMGKPLDAWLATEFFKHHPKQFKKRPIAWQLQSGKFTAKKAPAFACHVYFHKLNADTLPKIRTQYVGPLRQRLETELRGIHSVTAEARSDRQEKRRVELEDAIQELSAFDAKLEQVAREGFATPGLAKLLADERLDRWCSLDGKRPHPTTTAELVAQESAYAPDINDGVRVNIAPLQKAGLLAADVLAKKDLDKAIADRAQWRADERRWVRDGKLPQPGWWPEEHTS